ncbi:uncharacterized protein LOC111465988 [Cucurbita maxima]|uniref:Uncharacterized protein LOC111465988 n=1 Tax=Cucurbita maxima TaxID=3661 RepID=A0A6J1HMJ2_CUCMA|nr:uncharacterized protein LOC111465988 [Cucurbita maxima]
MGSMSGNFASLRFLLVRVLLFSILVILGRFAYVVTIAGESCSIGDFCFFSLPENFNFMIAGGGRTGSSALLTDNADPLVIGSSRADLYTSEDWIKTVQFYSSVFQDLITEGYVSANSKSLCIDTLTGADVSALKEIGVSDSIGIFKKALKPLVIKGEAHRIPFEDKTFDLVFSGGGRLDISRRAYDFASEIARILKPEGFAVVHVSSKDTYSFNSFVDLFNCCKIVRSKDIDVLLPSMPLIREYVLKKENKILEKGLVDADSYKRNCSVPGFKLSLVRNAEPLILEEPLKPWLTLKRNIQNIKYLPSMAEISFKHRYVYVDVGARSYGSSIGSWFKKQYPKQNKTFEVYAIEADQTFHEQYSSKKGVTLLPYAAWVRNETLSFEINKDPGKEKEEKGTRGMGRIQPVRSLGRFDGEVNQIQGFDFANWLKNTVSDKDFVVLKMDVEGTEFELIPKLFETGAICLIDEMFLECHYNRWQRCCPGQRSTKYEKTYSQCIELVSSLRQSGVLVHQWW